MKIKKKPLLVIVILQFLFLDVILGQAEFKPPIAPVWSLKHRVWEDSLNTQQAVVDLVDGYRNRGIPVGSIIIDSPWSTAYNNFEWDYDLYPNPQKLIDDLHDQNVKVLMWFTSVINSTSKDVRHGKHPDLDFVKEKGYAINNGEESTWWKGSGVHIDFTNPEATEWFNNEMKKVTDMGIDGWKPDQAPTDFGDEIHTSIGMMSNEEYRPYPYRNAINFLKETYPNAIIKSRGYSHQGGFHADVEDLTICYSGDFMGDYQGLKHQIDNTYKSARLGYGNITFEIGGFWGATSEKNELIRYVQFATFCSAMDNGGMNGALTTHLPWYFDDETVDIYRYYVTLHHELIPYIFSESVNSHLNGGSMIKYTSLVNESHKLGDQIFIQAITSDDNNIDIYLPKDNNWIDFWTDEVYEAGEVVKNQNYSLKKYPIFIKAGAIIPMDITSDVTKYGKAEYEGKETILIYPSGKSEYLYHKPLGEGTEYSDVKINVNANEGTVNIEGESTDEYLFLVKSNEKPQEVKNADSWNYNTANKTIEIEKSGKNFKVEIIGLSELK